MRYSKLEGFEHVPLGFRPGNRFSWYIGKILLLATGFFFLWRVKIIGKENLHRTQELHRSGQKVMLDFDHFSSMDIPLPITFFWWYGYRGLARNLFFLIGYRWAERFLIKGADRAYIFPPSEAKKIPKLREGESHADRRLRFSERCRVIADEVGISTEVLNQQLEKGKLLWFSSQGTRMRSGVIDTPPAPNAIELIRKADWLTPIALEGTGQILPPQKSDSSGFNRWLSFIPRFWYPLTIIVGEPVRCCEITGANQLGLLRAQLHYFHGKKEIAGCYLPCLEEREKSEKRELLGT